MAAKTPQVKANVGFAHFQQWVDDPFLGRWMNSVEVGSEAWFNWLSGVEAKSFRFVPISNQQTTYTARREDRGSDEYWYAYKKIDRKTHKFYVGRSRDLSVERLEKVATQLANTCLGIASDESHANEDRDYVAFSGSTNTESYTNDLDCVTLSAEVQISKVCFTKEQLDAIAQEIILNTSITRKGKDSGAVKRAVKAFLDRLSPDISDKLPEKGD